jgi:hypothetical protein
MDTGYKVLLFIRPHGHRKVSAGKHGSDLGMNLSRFGRHLERSRSGGTKDFGRTGTV